MSINIGNYVWVPCEVKPGPFSNERMVRLQSVLGDWLGFVSPSYLKEPILEGQTLISALVVSLWDDKFSAKLPGEGITATLYNDVITKAIPRDSIQTGH